MSGPSRMMVITGGGSGLGRDLCHYFADRGTEVVVTDVDEQSAVETAQQLPGGRGRAYRLDVSDPGAIEDFVRELGGRVPQVLVNNAGLQHVARIEDFAPDRWRYLVDVMLTGPAMLIRALLPGMRRSGYGRIINIGSIHSLVASPFKSAYVAAKHGLLGLARSVALETSDTDVTINTICPSYIRTPLVEQQIASQAKVRGITEEDVVRQVMLEPMPKGVFITSDEIAATIEFLCSAAARNITGQTLVIDGGWTAR